MEIVLQFNKKSRSPLIDIAISLASQLNGGTSSLDEKVVEVKVSSFDKTFIDLLEIVSHLKKVIITVNNELINSPSLFLKTLACNEQCTVNGICTLLEQWNYIFYHLGIGEKPDSDDNIYDQVDINLESFNDKRLILKNERTSITFSRDVLIDNFIRAFDYPSRYCSNYDNSAIFNILKGFDEEITVSKGKGSGWICTPPLKEHLKEPDSNYLGFNIVKK